MKTLGQNFGFWLNSFDERQKEKHEMISRGIELVCKIVNVCSKKVGVNNIVLGFPLIIDSKNKTFLSVYLQDNTVLFGVFDANEQKIRYEFTQAEFDVLNYRVFEDFAYRCENKIWQKAKNKSFIELKSLSEAWDNYVIQNPALVSIVKKAKTDNTVFLEQKDLLEKE